MKKVILIIFLVISVISCNNSSSDWSFDNLHNKELPSVDTMKYKEFDASFSTIPNQVGINIFEQIIEPLKLDSSEFGKLWNFGIIDVQKVTARKSCEKLDSRNRYSDQSYLFQIEFRIQYDDSSDAIFCGQFIVDLKNQTIGTFLVNRDLDNFYGIRYANDDEFIKNIKNKIIKNTR